MKLLPRILLWLFGWLPIATAALAQETNGTPSTVVSSDANDQLVYFSSTSLLADDRRVVFLSDRSGQPNIWLHDSGTGPDKQLTFNQEGFLKSYAYFDGVPYRGFGRASVSVDAQRGIIHFIQGRQICSVDTQGVQHVLAEYPTNQMTAFTHVSADGTRLCVPTTDARVLDGDKQLKGRPGYDIDTGLNGVKCKGFRYTPDGAGSFFLGQEVGDLTGGVISPTLANMSWEFWEQQ